MTKIGSFQITEKGIVYLFENIFKQTEDQSFPFSFFTMQYGY